MNYLRTRCELSIYTLHNKRREVIHAAATVDFKQLRREWAGGTRNRSLSGKALLGPVSAVRMRTCTVLQTHNALFLAISAPALQVLLCLPQS
jgi:hypothetical protein